MPKNNPECSVIGGGLVGTLLAIFLAKRGLKIQIFERRIDPRLQTKTEGRSINLAISARGIYALNQIGIAEKILKKAIPMRGRMIHSLDQELTFQPYGKDETQYINSISRSELNCDLLDLAEKEYHIPIYFDHKLIQVDFEKQQLEFIGSSSKKKHTFTSSLIFGTDGTHSAVRKAMKRNPQFQFEEMDCGSAYKELTILDEKGTHKMEKNALHIWPRVNFMLIALPNFDGSFTCTLFLPKKGNPSFDKLNTSKEVNQFFQEHFPDAVPLLDKLTETFFNNPTGNLATIRCFPWSSREKNAVILGDAAHAIIPFFGQGMNCGFEDCTTLDQLLEKEGSKINWPNVLSKFEKIRKEKADAIAKMSIENFVEMRDHTGNPEFLLEKGVEKLLENQFPGKYVSRYSMVSFSRTPYDQAYELGQINKKILAELCKNIQNPEETDLTLAKELIKKNLTPFMERIQNGFRN